MFTEGQTVVLRRYKDLCCEFQRKLNGSIIDDHIFFYEIERYCGRLYEVLKVYDRSSPPRYTLTLPGDTMYRLWHFDEKFLEPINQERGESSEVN